MPDPEVWGPGDHPWVRRVNSHVIHETAHLREETSKRTKSIKIPSQCKNLYFRPYMIKGDGREDSQGNSLSPLLEPRYQTTVNHGLTGMTTLTVDVYTTR
jgi:hypothetical protein